jgi:hypothetical protein
VPGSLLLAPVALTELLGAACAPSHDCMMPDEQPARRPQCLGKGHSLKCKMERERKRNSKQRANHSSTQHRQLASANAAWGNGRSLKGKGQL